MPRLQLDSVELTDLDALAAWTALMSNPTFKLTSNFLNTFDFSEVVVRKIPYDSIIVFSSEKGGATLKAIIKPYLEKDGCSSADWDKVLHIRHENEVHVSLAQLQRVYGWERTATFNPDITSADSFDTAISEAIKVYHKHQLKAFEVAFNVKDYDPRDPTVCYRILENLTKAGLRQSTDSTYTGPSSTRCFWTRTFPKNIAFSFAKVLSDIGFPGTLYIESDINPGFFRIGLLERKMIEQLITLRAATTTDPSIDLSVSYNPTGIGYSVSSKSAQASASNPAALTHSTARLPTTAGAGPGTAAAGAGRTATHAAAVPFAFAPGGGAPRGPTAPPVSPTASAAPTVTTTTSLDPANPTTSAESARALPAPKEDFGPVI